MLFRSAAAHEAEVDFTMTDIDRLSRKVPVLCKVAPAKQDVHMEDVHRAGGSMSILGELKRVGVMGFEFVSWKNYATFLGNYHDTGNDFANSERIRFSMGLQVKNEDLSKPLYLVAAKTGCADRSEDRFGNPPVKYYTYSCNSFPDVLSVEDFSKGELGIIKRLD